MNPNHYLAVAIHYLLTHRPQWPAAAAVGKTLVSSGMIDRVVAALDRTLLEVPVGFKWFADGLFDGPSALAAKRARARASSAATAPSGPPTRTASSSTCSPPKSPPSPARIPASISRSSQATSARPTTPASTPPPPPNRKAALKTSPEAVRAQDLAGEPITAAHPAPGNDAPIGGLKVISPNGWFAARPSGTENIYKIYAESFKSEDHLKRIVEEAQSIVTEALQA